MSQSEQQAAVFGAQAMAKAMSNQDTTKAEALTVIGAIFRSAAEHAAASRPAMAA